MNFFVPGKIKKMYNNRRLKHESNKEFFNKKKIPPFFPYRPKQNLR